MIAFASLVLLCILLIPLLQLLNVFYLNPEVFLLSFFLSSYSVLPAEEEVSAYWD